MDSYPFDTICMKRLLLELGSNRVRGQCNVNHLSKRRLIISSPITGLQQIKYNIMAMLFSFTRMRAVPPIKASVGIASLMGYVVQYTRTNK